jgi:pantoate--beta-alanine ligase
VKIITSTLALKTEFNEIQKANFSLGLVPTMGALHEGHLSLIEESKKNNSHTIVSIFVNPTQFNNPEDLLNYPKPIDSDVSLLNSINCDYLFLPSIEEIYANDYLFPSINLGILDQIMEGKYRPGHFQGVCQIVYRLFDLIQPTNAYFGQKDFQQVAVIRFMSTFFNLPVKIISCKTKRDSRGLALSSRNLLLNSQEKENAYHIYKTLIFAKENKHLYTPKKLIQETTSFFHINQQLKLEYITIVNSTTLEELTEDWIEPSTICIVAYSGKTRLIDNLSLFDFN